MSQLVTNLFVPPRLSQEDTMAPLRHATTPPGTRVDYSLDKDALESVRKQFRRQREHDRWLAARRTARIKRVQLLEEALKPVPKPEPVECVFTNEQLDAAEEVVRRHLLGLLQDMTKDLPSEVAAACREAWAARDSWYLPPLPMEGTERPRKVLILGENQRMLGRPVEVRNPDGNKNHEHTCNLNRSICRALSIPNAAPAFHLVRMAASALSRMAKEDEVASWMMSSGPSLQGLALHTWSGGAYQPSLLEKEVHPLRFRLLPPRRFYTGYYVLVFTKEGRFIPKKTEEINRRIRLLLGN